MMKKRLMMFVLILAMALAGTACGRETDLISPDNDIASVSSDSVMKIEKGMTFEDIFLLLGKTKDMGSGMYVAQYVVDETRYLSIGFADLDDENPYSGEEWLDLTVPVLGIRGQVTDITAGEDKIVIHVEGMVEDDTMYDKASVTVDADTAVAADDGTLFDMGDIAMGDTVEVVFRGVVAESYPVQGKARSVTVIHNEG